MNQEQIKQQARQILDKFAKELAEVEKEHDVDFYADREEFEREEGKGQETKEGFKKKMLDNAPKHDNDFIIAERGGWK